MVFSFLLFIADKFLTCSLSCQWSGWL